MKLNEVSSERLTKAQCDGEFAERRLWTDEAETELIRQRL